MQRRWMGLVIGVTALGVGWLWAPHRPCPAPFAWLLTLPGIRAIGRPEEIITLLDVHPGQRVLDAGCGPGRVTLPLAERVGAEGTVTALDMQPRMLEIVHKLAAQRQLRNVRLLLCELGRGTLASLQPNTYDRAVLAHVLGETRDAAAALREIACVLIPGGRVAIVEHWGDVHYVRYRRVRELAEQAGLRLVKEQRFLLGHTTIWEKLNTHQSRRDT